MGSRRLPLLGAAAGAAAGVLVVGGLFATGVLERDRVVTGDEARVALVTAWERSREASYAMEGQFERDKPGAGVLESAVFEAQRPPDRIRRQFGGVEGVLDGQAITCTTDELGAFRCAPNGDAPDHESEVRAEVERLDSYLSTDPPLYDVASDGDECFLLQQRVVVPDPPYGRRARMCFDEDTGALRYLRVEANGGSDTFTATSIRVVTDADFRLENDPTYAARPVPESTTTTSTGAAEAPATMTDDELFAQCVDGGGERDVHAELYARGTSINDERWLGGADAGGTSPCLLRGVTYYLEQLAVPAG